eukprot:gene5539-31959_t
MMKLLVVVSTAALLQCAAVAAEEFSGDGNLVDKACTKEGGSLACGAACPSGCTGEYCPAVMHYCQGDGSCGTNAAPECTVVDARPSCSADGGSLACGAACPSGCTDEYCPAVMHYCQGDGSCGMNAAPDCTVVDGGENAAMTATGTAPLAIAVAVAAAAAMFP